MTVRVILGGQAASPGRSRTYGGGRFAHSIEEGPELAVEAAAASELDLRSPADRLTWAS
jgi:hypothetical protein